MMVKKIGTVLFLLLSLVYSGLGESAKTGTRLFLFLPYAGLGDSSKSLGNNQYATKTPYKPQQDPSTYEKIPDGFTLVFAETVARHGSRGLSAMKYDDAVLHMCDQAAVDGTITALGLAMKADVEKIMKANFFLGYKVEGITFNQTKGGYGNLSRTGIEEHQNLAMRFSARTASLLVSSTHSSRKMEVVNSGQDRAVDSSRFFAQSLKATLPETIRPMVVDAPADRYTLYFHKLSTANGDAIPDATGELYSVWNASQDYQAFAAGSDAAGYGRIALAKVEDGKNSRSIKESSRAVLERLFTQEFVDKIENGTYTFSNNGTRTFSSEDNALTITLQGDGKTKIAGIVDAASLLYELYIISASLSQEVSIDFSRYLPRCYAESFALLQDMEEFYLKGPSLKETDVTYRMAKGLVTDFFREVDSLKTGSNANIAKLRFTHAEILIPFVAFLGIPDGATPIAAGDTYSYENNTWRGSEICPMTANIQWDVYRNAGGQYLVKMYLNEKEMNFKSGTEKYLYGSTKFYYDYEGLRKVYLPD